MPINAISVVKKTIGRFFLRQQEQVIKDLTWRLETANQKLKLLSGATSDAIWDWDMRTNSISWNEGRRTLFGYTDQDKDYDYASWYSNIHPLDKEEVLTSLKDAIDTSNTDWKTFYRFRCASGIYKYTYNRGHILYSEGKPVQLINSMQDIDERMTTLQEVEKLSLVASKTENLVIITDAHENIEWVNDGFEKKMGYKSSEVIGKTPRFLQGKETNKEALLRIRKAIDAGASVTEELLNYTKDNRQIWLKININPVFDDKRKLIRLIAVETDITPHKEYENKIVSIANELSDLIENANAIIFGIDTQGVVNEWNTSAAELIGYIKQEAMGNKLVDFIDDPEQKEIVGRLCAKVLLGHSLKLQQFSVTNRAGRVENLLVSATPRRNEQDEIVGAIVVGQDITELTQYRNSLEQKVKDRTDELQAALKKEKELVELKNQFVAIASHEFRTPLSTINFTASFLHDHLEKLEPTDVKSKLKKIEKQVAHMTVLLEDVIMAGRSELNKIPVFKSSLYLRTFIDKIVEEVQQATKNTHQINLEYQVLLNVIETDEKLLRNILINLLTNAIKFSPDQKCIAFAIREVESNIIFEVKDQGIGISEKDQVRLFEPFQRGSNTKNISGTGLGLSIVKKAAEVLSGTIQLKSEVNQGTTVTITIPSAL